MQWLSFAYVSVILVAESAKVLSAINLWKICTRFWRVLKTVWELDFVFEGTGPWFVFCSSDNRQVYSRSICLALEKYLLWLSTEAFIYRWHDICNVSHLVIDLIYVRASLPVGLRKVPKRSQYFWQRTAWLEHIARDYFGYLVLYERTELFSFSFLSGPLGMLQCPTCGLALKCLWGVPTHYHAVYRRREVVLVWIRIVDFGLSSIRVGLHCVLDTFCMTRLNNSNYGILLLSWASWLQR